MDDDEDISGIIDEEGRLFGYVNVVDALVVLLVVAVGVAGAALVFGTGGATTTATTYATIDLGVQSDGVSAAISTGDTYEPSPETNMTITDVYRVPEGDGQRTIVRARLTGPETENGVEFDGELPRLGRDLAIRTSRYNASGEIQAVGQRDTLGLTERTAVLRANLTESQAASLSAGRQLRTGDRTVATVEDVAKYELDESERTRVYAEVSLLTHESSGTAYYGNTVLQEGATVQLPADGNRISATVDQLGSGLDRTTTTALVTDTVTSEEANAIQAGDRYVVAESSVGTLDEVAIYDTGTPDEKQVFATVNLETISLGDLPRFGQTIIRQGATVPFETNTYELDARIERLETGLQSSETTVLARDTIPTDDARSISAGDTYLVAGNSVATVESVSRYGTANADRTDVSVGLTLETLGYSEFPLFGSTFVRSGATIPFEASDYELDASVQRVGTTEQRGSPETRTATIEISNVRPETANAIGSGMTETNGGETVAEITSVERANATVVLTSDDGRIYQREHPVNEDVTITVDLSVRQTESGVRFKGDLLQQGSTVRLDLGTVTVEGTLLNPI